MADPQADNLLREIEEDLRREKYAKLWQQYGRYVIAGAVALVVAVAGYQGWKAYQLERRTEASRRFIEAVGVATNDRGAAAAMFNDLARSAPGGYQALARLQEAALFAGSGDRAQASEIYRQLERQSDDPLLRDLAVLNGAMLTMQTRPAAAEIASLRERLLPLTADANPWRYSARELLALLALEEGQTAAAREVLAKLIAEPQAPAGIRQRAQEMLVVLGNG